VPIDPPNPPDPPDKDEYIEPHKNKRRGNSTSYSPGKGRPLGTKNKRNQELAFWLEARGDKDPLEFLSEIVSDKVNGVTTELKVHAATQLAPYLYAKETPRKLISNPYQFDPVKTIEEAADRIAFYNSEAAKGVLDLGRASYQVTGGVGRGPEDL
jgi:hypothetical protein